MGKNNIQEIQPKLESLSNEAKINPIRIGKLLALFSLAYAAGYGFGMCVRLNDIFVIKRARQFPWLDNPGAIKPPLALDAVDWILLQEALSNIGYTQQQIKSLYQLQTKEWNEEKAKFGRTSFISKFKLFSQTGGEGLGIGRAPSTHVPVPAPVPQEKSPGAAGHDDKLQEHTAPSPSPGLSPSANPSPRLRHGANNK